MQLKILNRTFTKGISLSIAILALGLSFWLMNSASAEDYRCASPFYVAAEYDLFSDETQNPEFRRMDLSTIVVTNDGALSARVIVSLYDEACLARPTNRDRHHPACELLGQKTLEVYPGTQDLSILHPGSTLSLDQAQRVASRVRLEYIDYFEYFEIAHDDFYIKREDVESSYLLGIQVDIYRNLRAVDCRRMDGLPTGDLGERKQSLIQNVRFTNYMSLDEYVNNLSGITPQIRRRPNPKYSQLYPYSEPPEDADCGQWTRIESPPRDHDNLVLRAQEPKLNPDAPNNEAVHRIARNWWDEADPRKRWQGFVNEKRALSDWLRSSYFRPSLPDGTTKHPPEPIQGADGFALSLQAE